MTLPVLRRALLVSATLSHALPGLRTRLRHGEHVLLEVRATHSPGEGAGATPVMNPCAFRSAVLRVAAGTADRDERSLLGVSRDRGPAIDIGVVDEGAALPGGIYRTPIGDADVWAFATTLDASTAYRLGAPLVGEALPLPGVQTMGLRPDRGTGVSLLYVQTDPRRRRSLERPVVALLQSLVTRWTVHELTEPATPPERGTVAEEVLP
jgi:hypothetical protein